MSTPQNQLQQPSPLNFDGIVEPLTKRTSRAYDQNRPDSAWSLDRLGQIQTDFQKQFNKPLPLVNKGQGSIHNRWGYDHRNAADVSLNPTSAEGQWLRSYLKTNNAPFLAFDRAIPGVATSAHIHLGLPSQKTQQKFTIGAQQKSKPSAGLNFDGIVEPAEAQQPAPAVSPSVSGVNFDGIVESQPKTEKITSEVKPVEFQGETPQVPIEAAPSTVKPIDFVAGNAMPRKAGPTELMMRPFDEAPKGGTEEQLVEQRYKTPPSTELAQAVKVPFSPHLNPTEDDLVKGYLNAMGPEYAKYSEKYKQETGRNILSLQAGDVDRDPDGSAFVKPTRAAVDVLNAYVKSGGDINAAKAEGARIARERSGAATTAEQQAAPDIAEVEAGRKGLGTYSGATRAIESPVLRYGAGKIQQIGGLVSGLGIAPNRLSDYLNTRGKIMELGSSLPPLTPQGEEIKRSVPEKVGAALGDLGLGVFDIIALKRVTGLSTGQVMALEAALRDTDKPLPQRGLEVAKAYTLGKILDGHLNRAMSSAMFAVPAGVEGAQQVVRGEKSKIDALLDVAIQGGFGAAVSGGKSEGLTELGIERAPTVGVPGEATANIDQRLAERESKVAPTFLRDDVGNPVARILNPDEVAEGAKPKVRPIHHSDTQVRDDTGKFVEQPASEPNQLVKPATTELPSVSPQREAATTSQDATTASPSEGGVAQHIRKVFDEPAKTQEGTRIVAYDLTLPDQPPQRATLAIKDGVADLSVGPPRGQFMVELDEGNYQVPRAELGARTVLAVKRFLQREHPEITEFKFARGGSTGGEYGRERTLTTKPQESLPNRRLADRRVVKGEPPDVNVEQRAEIEQQGSAAKSTPTLDRELGIGKTGQVYSVRTFISQIPVNDLRKIAELDVSEFSHLSTESAHQRAFDKLWKSLSQDARDRLLELNATTEGTKQEPVSSLGIRKAAIEQLASKETAGTEVDQELARLAPSRPERRQSERRVAAPKVEGEVSVPPKPTMDLADWRKGGYVEVPVTYVRFGDLPEGKSGQFLDGKRVGEEAGVSVYAAWKDPRTGKYVIRAPGDADVVTLENLTGDIGSKGGRKVYEIEGEPLKGVGGDEESLLRAGSGRVVREIHPDELVTDSEPRITLAGRELEGGDIPDWTQQVTVTAPQEAPKGEVATKPVQAPKTAEPIPEPSKTTAAVPELQKFADQAFEIRQKAESPDLTSFERAAINRKAARLEAKARGEELRHAGADPYELLDDIIIRGGELIRAGKSSFEEWSKKLREEFGPEASAHLKNVWSQLASPVPDVPRPADTGIKDDLIPSTTSARKDQLAADRAELDLPELPQAERKGWRTSLINAKEKGLDQRADRLADQVLANPRALDDEQTAGMVLKLQQLKNEHADLLDKIATEPDVDQLAQHRADLESVEQLFDKITEAVKKSGSEKGRSLASQKLTINQDFDLVSMLNRYKAKTGKEPTPEIRAQIESQQKRIADLEKQLTERSTKSGLDKIAREVRRENRQRTRKVLDEEAATIKTNIAAEFARLKSQSTAGQFKSQSGLGALDPDGVITKNALKYAKNRFEAGLTDASQLVDDVHKVLSEFADVTKRQVAEMISGYGGLKPRETKEQLEKTLADLRKEMRDALRQADVDAGKIAVRPEGPKLSEGVGPREGPSLGPKQGPTLREGVGKKEGPALGPKQGPRLREGFRQLEGPRLSEGIGRKEGPSLGPKQGPPETKPQIQKRYQKQINEIERRIREQDFAPKAKRGPTVLDSDTQKIQVELERAKQNFQRKLREWQSSQRTRTEKVADLAVNWSRAAKLMYVSTLGKLSSAATGRMVMSPIENLIGEIPHRLMPELSRRATTEGGGFNRAAEVAALWKSGRFRQVLDQLTKGSSDLDVLLGSTKSIDKEMSSGGLLGIPGRVHGAFKEYPRQAEFDRAFVKVLRNYDQQGRDITRPDVQLAARMEAFNSAERARFQQRNIISDGFNNLMGWFERQGGLGKGIGKGGRFIFPITRVPVNVVGETVNYTFGLPRAAVEHMWRNARGTMTPEKADNIMRAYKKGGIGLAVMTYAFLNPKQFGGYYQKGDKRDPNEPQPGEVMFFGKRIPKIFTHIPILEAAQLAATARRVMDRMTEQGKSDAVIEGGIAAGKGLAEQVPFYETPARFFTGKEGARGVAELAGEQTRGMIPGFIQEAAKVTDKDKEGELIPRAPQGGFAQRFAQTVKMGVPSLRQQVPINERKVSQQRKAGFQERFMHGKITETDLDRAAQKSELTQSDINSILEEKDLQQQYNPAQLAFYKTPTLTPNKTSTALDRYERMTPRMQADVKEIMQEKADAILDSDALTEEQKKTFAERLKRVGLLVRGWKEEK